MSTDPSNDQTHDPEPESMPVVNQQYLESRGREEGKKIQWTDGVAALIKEGAMFYRNASGALSIAYVASGRLLGYLEEHMNAWDCLAGQLLVEEAGGCVEMQDASEMIRIGGRVVVGAPGVFDALLAIANDAWGNSET